MLQCQVLTSILNSAIFLTSHCKNFNSISASSKTIKLLLLFPREEKVVLMAEEKEEEEERPRARR